jgi:hypothetical protein
MLTRGVRDEVEGDEDGEVDPGDGMDVGAEGQTVPGPAATYGPDLEEIKEAPSDDAETEAPDVEADTEPVPPRRRPQAPPLESRPEPEPHAVEADESPSFAAWPRRQEEQRARPPGSTWPPLEQGRPERLRRRRAKPEE